MALVTTSLLTNQICWSDKIKTEDITMAKNVSEETQKEAKHTEGAELKQRRWHCVFSFLSSQKKQKQTKTDYLKVIQFKTENLYHSHDMSSELINHFDMYLFVQTFTDTFQVTVFITATVTTCTPMTAYFLFGCNRYSSHFL